jgi:hypothetical protein
LCPFWATEAASAVDAPLAGSDGYAFPEAPHACFEDADRRVNRGLDLSGYRKVLLEPTEIKVQDESGLHSAQDAGASEVAAYADRRLREELSRSFELVDAPDRDVLRIRFRILDAQPTSKGQVAMMLPPFSMINMVSPKGIFTGSVTIAGEFREGFSEDMSVAFVAYGTRPGMDASVAFRPWDAAKKVTDRIAVRLARDLEGLRQD